MSAKSLSVLWGAFLGVTFLTCCPPRAIAQSVVVHSLEAENETDWSQPSFWETVDGKPAELSWEFSDGEIRLVRPRGSSGSLLSGPLPAHFELAWQWKIDPGCNTGLKYRVRRFGKKWRGLEYQIIDDAPSALGRGSTASIYDLVEPTDVKHVLPAGQWNASRVVAMGRRLEHYLNGQLVASVRAAGPTWQARLALSKFWDDVGFGQPADDDRVMLTDHGGRAVFKDFRFVASPAPPDTTPPPARGPFLGNAMRNSWADSSSIVLWTRTTAFAEMKTDGPEFESIDKQRAAALSEMTDPDELLGVQLPEGTRLSEMVGACPGAPGEVRLTYFPAIRRRPATTTPWVETSPASDFTAQWRLEDLAPDREYAAVVEARPRGGGDTTAVVRGGFRTAPRADQRKPITFCMTTCHDFLRRDDGWKGHQIYTSMPKLEPDFVVHAGDIEYYDKPEPWAWTTDLMRFKWARIFSLPSNRDFYQRTTTYFLKDDHDTLKNDCWAGQSFGAVTFAEGVRLFNEEQFPSRSPRYQTVRWGRDLQIWLLEGRDFRSPNNLPDGPQKTILGAEQKQWLKNTLAESNATFKLVFSPTPIVGPDRDNKKDNHANDVFAFEGDELRRELSQYDGLVVFCGDRHWQYASVDQETDLWEFGCGPGSEKHQLGWKKGDERPTHRFLRVAGGFLSGELAYRNQRKSPPRLIIRHHEVQGEPVSEFVFPADGDG